MILRLFLLLSVAALAQADEPFPPHHIIGNLYYVGSHDLASFLITTPRGHILINSSYERTVPLIEASVEKLRIPFSGYQHPARQSRAWRSRRRQSTGQTVDWSDCHGDAGGR
jgi:hypothetical protein